MVSVFAIRDMAAYVRNYAISDVSDTAHPLDSGIPWTCDAATNISSTADLHLVARK